MKPSKSAKEYVEDVQRNFTIYVGFWRNSKEPHLPFPQEEETSEGIAELNYNLLVRAQLLAKTKAYKGMSLCRICNQGVGNREYSLGRYVWPEGLAHYVKVHKVGLSDKFRLYLTHKVIN